MAINYEPVVLMVNGFDNESAWSKFWLGVVVAVFLDRRTSMVNYYTVDICLSVGTCLLVLTCCSVIFLCWL